MSELNLKKAGMGLTECTSEFEEAWKAAEPAQNCEKINPYAVTDSTSHSQLGKTTPQTNQTSFLKAGSPNSENNGLSSSPAILHLPLHCQTQICGRASWENNGSNQGSVLSNPTSTVPDSKHDSNSPTTEDRKGMIVLKSTDRAVFSDQTDSRTTTVNSWPSPASVCHGIVGKPWKLSGVSLALSGVKSKEETCPSEEQEGLEEACDLSPREKVAPAKGRSFVSWLSSGPPKAPPCRRENVDVFLKSEGPEEQGEDQIIEVDGWCHVPRFPVRSSATDKSMQNCWGLPEAEVRVWGAQILLALESLHQQGILCRDLNPRNVLLTGNGEFIKYL